MRYAISIVLITMIHIIGAESILCINMFVIIDFNAEIFSAMVVDTIALWERSLNTDFCDFSSLIAAIKMISTIHLKSV